MINEQIIQQIWLKSRSQNGWLNKEVADEQIIAMYDLLKNAPTSVNSCPARFTFVKSAKAKDRLKPCVDAGNVEKTITAPYVAIIAYDTKFYEQLPKLFPHENAKAWYEGNLKKIKEVSYMNAVLQGAYLMLAARSIGLDYGPIGGFDNAMVDREFFADGKYKSIFLCGIGYGDNSKVYEKLPRLDFKEACSIL